MQNGNGKNTGIPHDPAATRTKPKQQRSNTLPDFRFVRCELDSTHKSDLIKGISDGSLNMDICFGLVERGYKLSVTSDPKNRTYIATLTDSREGSPTRNMGLSGRGATIATAMCAVAYKHFFVLAEQWLDAETNRDKDEWGLG